MKRPDLSAGGFPINRKAGFLLLITLTVGPAATVEACLITSEQAYSTSYPKSRNY